MCIQNHCIVMATPVPVSSVHQVGQIQLTLLCERAEVFVMLEEV